MVLPSELLLQIRVTPAEKDGFKRAAMQSGLTLSAWARSVLRRTAAEDLAAFGETAPFAGKPRYVKPGDVTVTFAEGSATETLVRQMTERATEQGLIPAPVATGLAAVSAAAQIVGDGGTIKIHGVDPAIVPRETPAPAEDPPPFADEE